MVVLYGRIMMATVPHVISCLGLRKFQADGFLLTRVYMTLLLCNKRIHSPGINNSQNVFSCEICHAYLLTVKRKRYNPLHWTKANNTIRLYWQKPLVMKKLQMWRFFINIFEVPCWLCVLFKTPPIPPTTTPKYIYIHVYIFYSTFSS